MKVDMNNAGTHFMLLEPVEYPAWGITVPAGYATDFASIPKFLGSVYPSTGWYAHAAVLHDYCYDCHHANRDIVSRKTADYMFREQMRLDGVGWRTRWLFWAGVRVFGNPVWAGILGV